MNEQDDTKRLDWVFENCKVLITGMPFDITDREDIDAAIKKEAPTRNASPMSEDEQLDENKTNPRSTNP